MPYIHPSNTLYTPTHPSNPCVRACVCASYARARARGGVPCESWDTTLEDPCTLR
eukprot:NODE_4492_length_317_cov_10.783582_g4410_i0.p4 GENE.NODE_4492_length_317_cov_10.783582_g4410_i0~~NODE_4492_length_317_cov_10.783582_g4410_i0.p4  ORF type:complete len:55 (-),score=11.45 NODE_4492_length_317_cov_10.783582_g4410_i0:17-181(-)